MEKAQLVFIPWPRMGHLVSAVEFAKLLLTHDHRLSITVLVLNLSSGNPSQFHSYIESLQASSSTIPNRLQFIVLPKDELELLDFVSFFERQKPHVKEAVLKITQSELAADSPAPRLAGAAFLGFMLYVQKIHDEEKFDPVEFKNSDAELRVPSLVNSFTGRVMPSAMLIRELLPTLFDSIRRFQEAKGIVVNTFLELESYAIESLIMPPIYPVGPILDVSSDGRNTHPEIMKWLDEQPPSSVVFICFGSNGSLEKDQVKELAYALEHSGYRFLWSLRHPPPSAAEASLSDYENPQEVLPEGFLDRTARIGKVIGWAPQVAVLAHPAVGGFVSHCGWNSLLESIWFGVAVAAWPIYAEQQFNAFEMVIELGLSVEIKMDYRNDSGEIVKCDEIERGIKCLMEDDSEKKKKVKEMSEKSRMALRNGGSSYLSLGKFLKDVVDNLNKM
ncbi:hypothetical protein MANES_07G018500v8 [Manihot esculenta]|uniref:Uncharacterized protein n=1 Tax=Manihot esculenta TaxID=3983 RepID=A0ACB7HCM3_MANES|nr:hypothetical protein MANES_07G018500v8 [Manihot esculenta]